jgi:chorismate dehydratase
MVRVGAVNYLNTKPLIEKLTSFGPAIDLTLDLPSRLADQMAEGELDVGLIPVIEFFRAEDYSFIPGIAIASRGPVLSVTLFSRVPWGEIRTLALDEGSRTSATLAKLILAHRHGVMPQFEQLPMAVPADDVSTDAVLLIGDRAMHACLPGFRYAYDLGEEWTNWTGLPMVFALWAVRGGVELDRETEQAFHLAKAYSLAHSGELAAREAAKLGIDPGYCRRYFTNIIHYDLGERELAGLRRYYELAVELGLAPAGVSLDVEYRPDFVESRGG